MRRARGRHRSAPRMRGCSFRVRVGGRQPIRPAQAKAAATPLSSVAMTTLLATHDNTVKRGPRWPNRRAVLLGVTVWRTVWFWATRRSNDDVAVRVVNEIMALSRGWVSGG